MSIVPLLDHLLRLLHQVLHHLVSVILLDNLISRLLLLIPCTCLLGQTAIIVLHDLVYIVFKPRMQLPQHELFVSQLPLLEQTIGQLVLEDHKLLILQLHLVLVAISEFQILAQLLLG